MKLQILHSDDASLIGRVFVLDPAQPIVTIGRDPSATIVLPDQGLSRRHARIEWTEGAWILHDENSTNGIRLNGTPVREAKLADRDRIGIGNALLVVDPNATDEPRYTIRFDDGLTGLANLRHMVQQLAVMLEDPRPLSIVRFDVERMTAVNEAHGHESGDRFLVQLAARLRAEVPDGALLARVAGDVFVLALRTDAPEALSVAADIRARVLARAFVIDDHYVRPGLAVGVASEPRSPEALLRASKDDLQARRPRSAGTEGAFEWALGLWTREAARTVDVGAGAGDGMFVVSDGEGGHCTGWLGARFAVRVLLERFARTTCLMGAADLVPDEWGWAGAMGSRAAGEDIYAACVQELGDIAALELPDVFTAIDRVLSTVPSRARITSPMVGCTAMRLDGARAIGAHVGRGMARVLRAGATRFEEVAVPHVMQNVADRMPSLQRIDPALMPPNILCNGLGSLAEGVGVDTFDVELGPGDCLLLTSTNTALPDVELVGNGSLATHVRSIERRLSAISAAADGPSDVAFALIRRSEAS